MLYFSCYIFPYYIYPWQWANINNEKYWCRTVNHSTIEIRKKGTQYIITAKIEEKQISFDTECTWDRQNRAQGSEISWQLGKETEGILNISW